MSPHRVLRLALLVLAVLAVAAPPPGRAVPPFEERHLEGFAGYYSIDAGALDFDTPTILGVRGGARWERFGLEGSLSRFDSDFELDRTEGEQEILALDLSATLHLNPWDRFEWALFAGPGLVSVDVTNRFDSFEGRREVSTDTERLSGHAGVAVRIGFGERLYLRPEARARIYDATGGIATDFELSVAFGYSFF